MTADVSSLQLRDTLSEILSAREAEISDIREQHERDLSELHRLLSKKHHPGTHFPSVDLDDVEVYEQFETYDQWREAYLLQPGPSRINRLDLPTLPPPSPAIGVTIFPDERVDNAVATSFSPAPDQAQDLHSTLAMPGSEYDEARTRPPITVTLSDIQPRMRRQYSPTIAAAIPEWIPLTNYNPSDKPPSTPPLQFLMPLESTYAANLPPLPAPPPSKRHKRTSKADDKKAEAYRLAKEFELNPISSALGESAKVVLSADWMIATAEMRHIRAVERIEAKKDAGRWNLRQPKKLRAPPVPKAHWDYLLEEMEWLRTDIVEEKRWKQVLALEFAYQVVEWHLANPEQRASLMVGGRGWGSSSQTAIPGREGPATGANSAEDDVEMLIGDGVDLSPEVETDPAEPTAAEVLDEIIPSVKRESRASGRKRKAQSDTEEEVAKDEQPKNEKVEEEVAVNAVGAGQTEDTGAEEEGDDADADGEEEDAEGEMDVDAAAGLEAPETPHGDVDAEGEEEEQVDIEQPAIGLSDIDAVPPPDQGDVDADGEADEATSADVRRDIVYPNGVVVNRRFENRDELCRTRRPLLDASLTTAVFDCDDLPKLKRDQAANAGPSEEDFENPLTMLELFPDMSIYSGPTPPEDGKLHKRLDEGHTTGHRLAHTSRLMDIQPVLVSHLQPAKNAASGEWDLYEGLYAEDPKGSTDVPPEVNAVTTTLFYGKRARPVAPSHHAPMSLPDAQKLRVPLVWTEEEDQALKHLVATYPFNWALIADNFNSSVVVIPTETRIPYDCWERWHYTFGPGKGQRKPTDVPETESTSAPTTGVPSTPVASQGVQAQAAPNRNPAPQQPGITVQNGPISIPTLPTAPNGNGATGDRGEAPPPPGLSKREAKAAARSKYEGTKKAIRHQVLYDSVRRLIRRRQGNTEKGKAKDQPEKIITVHESHSQYLGNQILTPLELVEAKWQRDARAHQMRQDRQMQEQQQRAAVMRQQAAAISSQGRPGIPGGMPNGLPVQMQNGGVPRLGPNGQPIPIPQQMGASQQHILNAVAAVTGANRVANGQNAPMGSAAIRPHPNLGQQVPMNPAAAQQMQQILHAQGYTAQQASQAAAQVQAAQAHAQAQARAQSQASQRASSGTPHSQPANLSASPFSQAPNDLPNGAGGDGLHGSPAMQAGGIHTSPQLPPGMMQQPQQNALARVPSLPMQAPQMRVPSGGNGQPGNQGQIQVPVQGGGVMPAISNELMQQLLAHLTANGQNPTPELMRSSMAAYMRSQAQQQQQQQQQQQSAQANSNPQQSPMAASNNIQGVPQFARSPSVQVRGSPSTG